MKITHIDKTWVRNETSVNEISVEGKNITIIMDDNRHRTGTVVVETIEWKPMPDTGTKLEDEVTIINGFWIETGGPMWKSNATQMTEGEIDSLNKIVKADKDCLDRLED